MNRFNLLLLTCLFCSTIYGQLPPGQYSTTNKKAISLFQDAIKYFQANNIERAIEYANDAAKKAPEFVEPHLLLAEIYHSTRKAHESIDEYKKAIAINPKFSLDSYFTLGQLEMMTGKYEDAKQHFEIFLTKPHINPKSEKIAKTQLKNSEFGIRAMKNPVPFNPKNMGTEINSKMDEYFPAITADDQLFLFTRNNRSEKQHQQEDFYMSKKINGKWETAKPMGNGINTSENEGSPCLSADGQLLFFVACAGVDGKYTANRKGFGSCDIFYSEKVGNNWAVPYNINGPINTKFWESQPSFSSDGKTLYFVSSRPGGLGDSDIWYSQLQDDGSWGTAVNMGPKINTVGGEESVCIHPDGQTLYFGSDGHEGMGGLDLYVVRKNEKGEWGTPENLGYPINTYGDENSILVSGDGKLAYFASTRDGGQGGLDLYEFELYEAVRPKQITYMKGKVFDAKTKKALGAHFELIDLESGKTVITSDANTENGEFLVTLPIDKNYALNASHKGYLFYSENFSLKNFTEKDKHFTMDVPLQPLDTGSVVELKNVFFETAKFDLKPESKVELDKLAAFLNANKTLKIELSGHTDNVGDKKSNQLLSQNRAKAVYDFLIQNNIPANRLTFKGYGDTQPKVKNDTDENRAKNRRTEFKIVSK